MKPGELIDLCIECYKTYQPSKVTLDSHIEVFLAKIDCNDEGDVVFIKQVVYGCIRYKKLNKVTLTALYFKHGTQVSREDYHLYMVFSYLTLIRLEDMSVPVFRKFVMSQDHHKMFVWVSFIFNAQTLNKWMKEEWCRIFDEQYVEDDLIAKLLRNLPEISDLIERLREIASTKDEDDIAASDDKKEKKVTRPVPFQLSKPKPRMVPEPFPIHLGNPYKQPIPATTFDADVDPTRKKVDEARQKARDEVAKKAAHARAPEFATAKLPESKVVRAGKYKDALAQEHEQKLQAATRYVPAQPSDPAPALKAAETASVRLNTAAVLREDALLRKKQMEEAALIKKYESELRDDSEYYEWQARMRERDERKRLEEVEQRRVQMLLTQENALEARIQNERDNHRFASEMRKEASAIRELYKLEKEQVLLEKQGMVADVKESEKLVAPALEKVREQKVMVGIELREEAKRLEEEAKEQRAKEEAERMEIVRQIRAMESVPVDREAHFDPTSVAEQSKVLLEAMSMAELKERLNLVKRDHKDKEVLKRKEILQEKQAREEDLIHRMKTIHKVRGIREQDAKEQRKRKLQKEAEKKEVALRIREEAQAKLQIEIEKKRRQRLEEEELLQREMERIKIKEQFLAAGAAQVEEKKYKELESGAERKLRERQERERLEHEAFVLAMTNEDKNRTRVLKQRAEEKKVFMREYDTRHREGIASMVDALATAHAEKRITVAKTRDFESSLRDRAIIADPNKHLVNTKSVMDARRYREARLGGSMGSAASRGGLTVKDEVLQRGRTIRAQLAATQGATTVSFADGAP